MLKVFYSLLLCFFLKTSLYGGICYVNGKWSYERYVPQYSVQEHYDFGCLDFSEQDYEKAQVHFLTIIYHFYDSPFYADALYYAGACLFETKEYDLANKYFSFYLELASLPRHFEKVFEYKFRIAEAFRQGAKKHIFELKMLPKIAPSKGNALELYDEVIVALPGADIAAQALFSKAKLLRKKREYNESIECLKTLTRRFPKHPLGAKSYYYISKIYLEQSCLEPQNPDFIALAQVNLDKMKKSFPGDEKSVALEQNLLKMKEVYGNSLYRTGLFYEKKKKLHAAAIYYNNAAQRFPETEAARVSQERLVAIDDYLVQWRASQKK